MYKYSNLSLNEYTPIQFNLIFCCWDCCLRHLFIQNSHSYTEIMISFFILFVFSFFLFNSHFVFVCLSLLFYLMLYGTLMVDILTVLPMFFLSYEIFYILLLKIESILSLSLHITQHKMLFKIYIHRFEFLCGGVYFNV